MKRNETTKFNDTKFDISAPNAVHQADLLLIFCQNKMPRGRKFYKYSLIVVDVASRRKEAEPQSSNFLRPGSGMLSRNMVGQLYILLYLFY